MQRKILIVIALFLGLAQAQADEVVINPDNPGTHIVVKGDTLWDIAGRFLTYPWQWPEIWEVNPQIENPHLIYPGDRVSLTYQDGRPILNLSRSGQNYVGGRRVKLSPAVRTYPHDYAIAPIPLDAIQQFLSRPQVMTKEQLELMAYVVDSQDRHLANGTGQRIYVRGIGEPTTNKYSILRPGGEYRDAETGELLGYEALHIGDVIIDKLGDPATAIITDSNREILKGDRLVPQQQDEYPEFFPHPPASGVTGNIISVIDGVSQIGQYQVVVLDRGAGDGLEPGHVLAIYQGGEMVEDALGTRIKAERDYQAKLASVDDIDSSVGRFVEHIANSFRKSRRSMDEFFGERRGGAPVLVQLPEERAGELMVFRTFDNVSYALVMNAQRPLHISDKVRTP